MTLSWPSSTQSLPILATSWILFATSDPPQLLHLKVGSYESEKCERMTIKKSSRTFLPPPLHKGSPDTRATGRTQPCPPPPERRRRTPSRQLLMRGAKMRGTTRLVCNQRCKSRSQWRAKRWNPGLMHSPECRRMDWLDSPPEKWS